MAEPAKIDLTTVKRGDTYIVDFYFSDTDGTKDISAVTIDAQARREMDGALWFDLKPVKVDASNGHFRIHLTHDETRAITESPPGSFSGIFDIQFSWQGAGEVYVSTIVAGSISISKDVTQPVILSTSGSSPMVPPSSQEVNVYLSLNPGSPNYSDVVTAEQLTPVQYDLSASLGLANVNAINEAGEAARAAEKFAAEAYASKVAARQSATLATIQATKATNEADRAKSEADKAKQVSGLDTVDQAVDMAMSEFAGLISESEARAIQRRNLEHFDASGFVHMGKTYPPGGNFAKVNEGLWTRGTTPNVVQIGRSSRQSGVGPSKTDFGVMHIAGAVVNLTGKVDTTDLSAVQFNLKPAPDGTDIYDSTGDCRGSGQPSLSLKTDIDPKYGNVPTGTEDQIRDEAVARAYEGDVKNGDFRNGDEGWRYNSDRGSVSYSDDGCTMTDTTNKSTSGSSLFIDNTGGYGTVKDNTYLVEIVVASQSDSANQASFAVRLGGYGDPLQRFETLQVGVNTFRYTAGLDVGSGSFLIYVGQLKSMKVSSVSVRLVTEEIVTHPVDLLTLEYYEEETDDEIMDCIQSTSTTFGTTSVPTVLSTRKLAYFQQYAGQFPEVVINPDFSNDRYRCVKWANLTEPQKREIAAYLGERLFKGFRGKMVNGRLRARTFRGAGNGDWVYVNDWSGAYNYLQYAYDARPAPQGIRDVVDEWTGASPSANYSQGGASNQRGNYDQAGVYAARHSVPEYYGYQGNCYMYVVAAVPRANQGAYHEKLNPYGTRAHVKDSAGDQSSRQWYESDVRKPTKVSDCFYLASYAGSTGYARDTTGYVGNPYGSGHPNGIFYDGIRDEGLNGVVDLRLGAKANDSSEEGAKTLSKLEDETYRGMESLVKTVITLGDTSGRNGKTFGLYSASDRIQIYGSDRSGRPYQSFLKVGDSVTFYNTTLDKLYSGRVTKVSADTVWVSDGTLDMDWGFNSANSDASMVYVVATEQINLSASGGLLVADVVGDLVDLTKVDVLKDGWMGGWIGKPEGSSGKLPLSRKATKTKGIRIASTDLGVSWGTYSDGFDSVSNSVYSSQNSGYVSIHHYTASAKSTKLSVNKPVLNSTKGLLGITVTQSHDKASLAEAVAGIILKSDASGIVTEQSQAVKYLVDGTIKRLKTLPTDMVAPTNNSQAIKIAVYQISNNGQTSLAIIANTMTHNGTSWGELDEIHIPSSGSGTFQDGNNITQQAICTELSIPTGWTSNRARVGTQVEGVDL